MSSQFIVGVAFLAGLTLGYAQPAGLVGVWELNEELSSPVPSPDADRPPAGRRGGPPGGGGGRPGGPGGPGGMPGMGREPSERDMRRVSVVMRRLSEPPASLTISRDGTRMTLVSADGRSLSYTADGRKQQHVSGDGEFSSRAHFEGDAFEVEEDFGGGIKLTSHYLPVDRDGAQRLEVTLKASGLPAIRQRPGGDRQDERRPAAPPGTALRVYQRPPAM